MNHLPPALPVEANHTPVVRLNGVSLSYGTNRVLNEVYLDLAPGTITALLGTNGAGKSTLIGVLSGVNPHYTGSVELDGSPHSLSSVTRARALGIETVHQRISDGIVPGLSVADNLVLTDYAAQGARRVRKRDTLGAARSALQLLGLTWSDRVLRADARHLGTSEAQLVILARALRTSPRVLILDEPTSALTATEADRLFEVLRSLRDRGIALLFVSHRFGEISRIADRIAVLRDGAITLTATAPFDWQRALTAMLGASTALEASITEPFPRGQQAINIRTESLLPGSPALSFSIHDGQVTGILGLLGAGKTELAETLVGLRHPAHTTITVNGHTTQKLTVARAREAGVVLVPEDRQRDAIHPGWSIARTVSLPVLTQVSTGGVIRRRSEHTLGAEVIDHYDVVARSPEDTLDELSGGNQQKVSVGRWLRTTPRIALLDEPFRGVDIGARRSIGSAARAHAAAGNAIVVLSSDIDEILEIADRIVVLVAGSITGDFEAGSADRQRILSALLGDAAENTTAQHPPGASTDTTRTPQESA